MAASRVRKLGTIFTRTQGLIRSGAMRREKIPVWYNVYEAFPPLDKFDVEANEPDSAQNLRKLLYPEDIIRMKFYERYGTPELINLESNVETLSQKFAKFYIAKKSSEKQKLSAGREAEGRLADKEERLADKEERLADTEERVADTEERVAATEERLAAPEERLAAPEEGGTQEKPEGESDITFENILRVFAHEHNLKMSQADVKRQKKKRRRESIQMRTLKKRKPLPADPVAILGTWDELERL
uniref:Small ribosomal subunit protein mS23 n=1 Tax=Crassostrea virginica TaxID=6565 RepID=A0A8B8ESM3_CRAVI|nr:28S ribosomal protein S23, mitochondrial-like [Crassostrea virginica]